MPELYVPDRATLLRVASQADVQLSPSTDWDARQWLSPPGLVWSVASDTCCTGRECAPENISYDENGAEFVFRQPRDERELAGVLRAARVEVYDCYRFDGLEQWTYNAARAWRETTHVIEGWLEHRLSTERDPDFAAGQSAYLRYLRSPTPGSYMGEILDYLRPG